VKEGEEGFLEGFQFCHLTQRKNEILISDLLVETPIRGKEGQNRVAWNAIGREGRSKRRKIIKLESFSYQKKKRGRDMAFGRIRPPKKRINGGSPKDTVFKGRSLEN